MIAGVTAKASHSINFNESLDSRSNSPERIQPHSGCQPPKNDNILRKTSWRIFFSSSFAEMAMIHLARTTGRIWSETELVNDSKRETRNMNRGTQKKIQGLKLVTF